MSEENKYLEVEAKYNADDIDCIKFKDLTKSLGPKSFLYVESTDVYYLRAENEFLRYRMPSENRLGGDEENRSELTFKKKSMDKNNWVRTEVNLRVDKNDPFLIHAFCEGLGYQRKTSPSRKAAIFTFTMMPIWSIIPSKAKMANTLHSLKLKPMRASEL